jgi:hypothetical protein
MLLFLIKEINYLCGFFFFEKLYLDAWICGRRGQMDHLYQTRRRREYYKNGKNNVMNNQYDKN